MSLAEFQKAAESSREVEIAVTPVPESIPEASPPHDALPAEEPPEPEDPVDRVIAESFPASDPPPWWMGPDPVS
jgi:hypothetical protein